MKNIIKIFLGLLLIGVSTSFAQTKEIKVRVDGLSCPFCAYGLEKKLNEIDGVENIYIDIEEGIVTLQMNSETVVSNEIINSIVKDAGFKPKEIYLSDKPFDEGEDKK